MKKILLTVIFFNLTSTVFASFPQNISICVSAIENSTAIAFLGEFYSSDWFDKGKKVSVNKAQQCVEHTYSYGPKKITLQITASGLKTKVVADESCYFMPRITQSSYRLDKFVTAYRNEHWRFSFKEEPKENGYYIFRMFCTHNYW